MGFADIPADTDLERVLKALDQMSERQDKFAEAINNLGLNVQWIVDNVQGIFQMFGSPQFAAMLPQMMSGGIPEAAMAAAENVNGESASE